MFVVASKYDSFTHRVGDIDSLEDLIFGLSNDKDDASRIAKIAGMLKPGDVLSASGFAVVYQEDK